LQHFTASDGVRIAYRDEGAGRPILLLHGLMAHSGFFEPQGALADNFRLIRMDLRAHGESGAGEPSVARIAADVAELAERLDLGGAIGVGWSLGASVLWRLLAGPVSDRFAAAVVIDMTPRVLNGGDWALGLSQEHCDARAEAMRADFPAFARAAGAAIFAESAEVGLGAWAGDEFARNDPAAIRALWFSLVAEDLRPFLSGIAQPTLVVHGSHSHLYGADTAEELTRALPNARALAFRRSGHAPHLEEPELFNAAIRDFAATLPPVHPVAIPA
jgi:pimeloyl-ACP methyl ester carboxylesterase